MALSKPLPFLTVQTMVQAYNFFYA